MATVGAHGFYAQTHSWEVCTDLWYEPRLEAPCFETAYLQLPDAADN